MKVMKFKIGDKIPDGSKFLKMETTIHRNYSDYSSCGCHIMLNCDCYEETTEKVFWYEIKSEDSNE